MWFRGPKRRKARERENEQIERKIRTSLIPTSSSVCMCVPVREKASSVFYSSYFGSVEVEINSHHPSSYTRCKGWWWVIFVTRIDSQPLVVSTKTNTHSCLRKKKLSFYSHLNIYPRKTRFLSFDRLCTCFRCAARCRWKSFYSFIFLLRFCCESACGK